MKWKEIAIGEVCKVGRGSSPRPINDKAYFEGGQIPWIKIADATKSGKIIFETKEHVNSYGASFSRLLPEGSLILATSGVSLGQVKFLGMEGCIHDGWLYLDDFKNFDRGFMYYLLIGLTSYFHSQSYGAAIQNINTDILRETKIPNPPIPTQQKIASILSTYDDLIENNLKRIRLLEEAAQHLYREWFVRFRFPGWEEVKVVDGLPEGWERKAIGAVCETVGGGTPSTKEPKFWDSGEVIWFSPTDLSKNSSLVLLDSASKITEEGLKSSSAKMLPPRTILMSSRATIGLFGIISKPCSTNQGFISIIPNEEYFRFYLLFNLLNRKQEIINNANGSTFKEISKKHFREMEIIMPTSDLTKQFHYLSESFLNQIENLECQNQKLKEARDILLPRLMNQTLKV